MSEKPSARVSRDLAMPPTIWLLDDAYSSVIRSIRLLEIDKPAQGRTVDARELMLQAAELLAAEKQERNRV